MNMNNKKDAKTAYRPYGYAMGKNISQPKLPQVTIGYFATEESQASRFQWLAVV